MAHVANFNVNYDKIDTSKLFQGEKGRYFNVEVWINDEFDKFGNNASLAQISGKDDSKVKNYLSNGKGKEVKHKAPETAPTNDF